MSAPLNAIVLLVVLLTVSCAPARAHSPAPIAVRAGTVPIISRYDFGPVRTADAEPLQQVFLLRNDGAVPLTISRFQPSCHCTTARLVPERPLPVTLAPGAQVSVFVSVTVAPYLAGPLQKSVGIYTPGRDDAFVTLILNADLHPPVVLSPQALDFGAVHAGRARSLTLTATVDAGLVFPDAERLPRLVASDPDIEILPLSAATGSLSDTHTYTYRVTLFPDAALGPVRDVLQFKSFVGAPSLSGLTLADGPGVPVTGMVVGTARAAPSSLAFGPVAQGHPATRTVTLTAVGRRVLARPQAHVGSRLVRLHWARVTPVSWLLKVLLASTAPPGSFSTQVTVTLRNGERLRLPVTAYVVTPEK